MAQRTGNGITLPLHSPGVIRAVRHGRVLGWLAVDSLVGGRCSGGLRIRPGLTDEELRLAARTMTLKYGLVGVPQGGAKAGVIGDGEAAPEERLAMVAEFAEAIRPLLIGRFYVPYGDIGTDATLIEAMLRGAGARIPRRRGAETPSGLYTAASVVAAAEAACEYLGMDVTSCRVAVEGFGKVGSAAAGLLARQGARVVAVSNSLGAIYDPDGLDVPQLARLAARHGRSAIAHYVGAQRFEPSVLPTLPADLLLPCAVFHTVRRDNAPAVTARIVCPGANNPWTEDAEAILLARGILCVPDFVANCGGVLGGTMQFAGIGRATILPFIRRQFRAAVGRLLEEAERSGRSIRSIAEQTALRRFEHVAGQAQRPGLLGRMMGAGLGVYRRRLVPAGLVGALARSYFRRRMEPLGESWLDDAFTR